MPMQNTSKLLIFVLIYHTLLNAQLLPIFTNRVFINKRWKNIQHYLSFGHFPKHIHFSWDPSRLTENIYTKAISLHENSEMDKSEL